MVSNRDIGFVQVGQEAEIKVQTFNFTRYGLLRGQVLTSVARRRRPRPGRNRPTTAGRGCRSGGHRRVGPVYAARIGLERTEMQIEDKL